MVYSIQCEECKVEFEYIGETAKSLGERFEEHFLSMNVKDSVFYGHKMGYHDGKDFEVSVEILNSHIGDPMRIQVSEGVCISEIKPKLERKEEWATGRIIRQTTQDFNLIICVTSFIAVTAFFFKKKHPLSCTVRCVFSVVCSVLN